MLTLWSQHGKHTMLCFVKQRCNDVEQSISQVCPGTRYISRIISELTNNQVLIQQQYIAMRTFIGLTLILFVHGDIFMTNPRGSNNRLNEKSNNRANGNRLFDSQNNNKGGYNVGDRFAGEAGKDPSRQYQIQYYESGPTLEESSRLIIEWANQHGCGGTNRKSRCNVVIQYMCMNNGTDADYPKSQEATPEGGKQRTAYMRDGVNTNTQGYAKPNRNIKQEKQTEYERRMAGNANVNTRYNYGLHESLVWYDMCRYREANAGLFRADQNLKNDKVGYVPSHKTRQNPGGTRRGFECPEERDYYPYWQPTLQGNYDKDSQKTAWLDAAYLGPGCGGIVKNSFNDRDKHRCVLNKYRDYGRSITKDACEEEGGNWVKFTSYLEVLEDVNNKADCEAKNKASPRNTIVWAPLRSDSTESKCIVKPPRTECGRIPSTRVNHLGNSFSHVNNASRFQWDIPHFPSGNVKRCVVRVRYNITTMDYDPYKTFSDQNGGNSPVTNNPTIDVFQNGNGLALAINTAQFGRTFQDRSHIFQVLPRLKSMTGKKLHNLNVRGQRGNIVQNYPSVEYDFVPDKLNIGQDDLVHIQWAGINTNVAGRAGEGKDGTDRNNFVELSGDPDTSYPYILSKATFWNNVVSLTDPSSSGHDIAISLASSGYFCGKAASKTCPAGMTVDGNNRAALQKQLDNAPASYFGHVVAFKGPGQVYYMCTRNNNFSNRSQKGMIYITPRK